MFGGKYPVPCPSSTCPPDTPNDAEVQAYVDMALSGNENHLAYNEEWITTTAAFSGLGAYHSIGLLWQIWNCHNHDGVVAPHREISGIYGGLGTQACNSSEMHFPAIITGQTWSMRTCDISESCPVPRTHGAMPIEMMRLSIWLCPSIDSKGKPGVPPNDVISVMNTRYAQPGSFRTDASDNLYKPRHYALRP